MPVVSVVLFLLTVIVGSVPHVEGDSWGRFKANHVIAVLFLLGGVGTWMLQVY